MVSLVSLWTPILVSAVIVFLASWAMHMVLGYHKADFRKLPSEDEVQEALRKFNIPPGDYMLPCPSGPQDMQNKEFLAKRERGPIMIATFLKGGPIQMGPPLLKWFIFCCVVGVFAAYVTGRTHGAGSAYLAVFRTAGTVAFCSYALAQWPDHIWYQRSLGTTLRNTFDGLVYGLLTAGVFGWLWPR